MSATIEAVVERFFAAVERNDFAAVGMLYADDMKTWRSFDLGSQDKAEELASLGALNARFSSSYRVIERHFIGEQMIQRHELTLREKDGTVAHRLQAAVFLTIRDGQIHFFAEYLDSRDVAQLAEAKKRGPANAAEG